MKILNFGSCNIDRVYRMQHITASGETNSVESFRMYPGGKGLNQSVAIARAGGEVYHAGKIGTDGRFLLDLMQSAGVHTDLLQVTDTETGHAVIQVDDEGRNAIFVYPGSNFLMKQSEIDRWLDRFSVGDILTVQNETNCVGYAVQKAAAKGMKVFYNPSPFNERIHEVNLSLVFCLVVNETEAAAFVPGADVTEFLSVMRRKYPNLRVLLTLGSRGSVYSAEGHTVWCPAYRVKAVDTTAAGDTFTGYFLSAFAEGADAKSALERASAAAALAVSHKGAASSIPMADAVGAVVGKIQCCPQTKDGTLAQMTEIVREHISDVTPAFLAKELGYSENYIGKLIRQVSGCTFFSFVSDLRLSLAADLLVDTDLPIGEVIMRVGYKNETFFRRSFKMKYGKTPTEYRRERK